MTTLREALNDAITTLERRSPSPRLDAEVLLAHVLGVSRALVVAEGPSSLAGDRLKQFRELVERRAALEPVAYITGRKEFYGYDFYVDHRVLVPRPETELVVDLALRWWATHSETATTQGIADIGTGSGCLAVSLALKLPQATIYAVDISLDALEVARRNAERHAVLQRVTLLHGDGCAPLPVPVNMIVSNPPYTVLEEIDENVRRWEPHLALDGAGDRGFEIPQRLLAEMRSWLKPGGVILMEIGAWQGAQALAAARRVFPGSMARLHKDLAGHDRVLEVQH